MAAEVHLIAHTVLNREKLDSLGTGYVHRPTTADSDELAEFAGRNCYLSFDRPSKRTFENRDYIGNIIGLQHESVFEHGSASFYVHTSRSVLTELERHRHLSFSVVSQRYVDASQLGYHEPPLIEQLLERSRERAQGILDQHWRSTVRAYNELVDLFVDDGFERKAAREAARAVLPNMVDSPMVVSGNHRAWRYVIRNRFHVKADAEIREVAGQMLAELRKVAPAIYQDFPDTPFK